MRYLGVDIGSVSAKFVVLNSDGKVLDKVYARNSNILATLKTCLKRFAGLGICGVCVTGSGRELASKIIGADLVVTEIIAHGTASIDLMPDVRTIIDIGGEDSKLIVVKDGKIVDFVMNTDCGGGTGAMIESVCQRLGIELEHASDLALTSDAELVLPSKCGVFCQSALVSKKNMGVPANDILMAVLRGIVSNYLAILGKGKDFNEPIMFQGACARNKALAKAFEDELKSKIIIPKDCEFMGAIGAALLLLGKGDSQRPIDLGKIADSNFITKSAVAEGCANRCELIRIYDSDKLIATFGNRCDKCGG